VALVEDDDAVRLTGSCRVDRSQEVVGDGDLGRTLGAPTRAVCRDEAIGATIRT